MKVDFDLYIGKVFRPSGFCGECGSPLQVTLVGAETNNDYEFGLTHTKYNPETGERQYSLHYRCPKKRWYNFHHEWTSSEVYKKGKK